MSKSVITTATLDDKQQALSKRTYPTVTIEDDAFERQVSYDVSLLQRPLIATIARARLSDAYALVICTCCRRTRAI